VPCGAEFWVLFFFVCVPESVDYGAGGRDLHEICMEVSMHSVFFFSFGLLIKRRVGKFNIALIFLSKIFM
jgi:hypothetical protein